MPVLAQAQHGPRVEFRDQFRQFPQIRWAVIGTDGKEWPAGEMRSHAAQGRGLGPLDVELDVEASRPPGDVVEAYEIDPRSLSALGEV